MADDPKRPTYEEQQRQIIALDLRAKEILAELNANLRADRRAVDAGMARMDRIEADIAELKKRIG